jgi:hypothetical protein
MNKLILIQWDIQVGPQPIVQYPPEEQFPAKEVLLKIWAVHETKIGDSFIEIALQNVKFCSLLKKSENKNYFVVLEIDLNEDSSIFREILENVADDLLRSLNTPQFPHILSDTYKTIKNYSDMDESQLYLRLFDEKIRLDIFSILRMGVITKKQLVLELQRKFGYANINIELLLTPFLRMGLIKNEMTIGEDESVYLIKDVYTCLLPMVKPPLPAKIEQNLKNLYNSSQILDESWVYQLSPILLQPDIQKLMQRLKKQGLNGVPKGDVLKMVKSQPVVLDRLKNFQILIEFDDLYLLQTYPHFFHIHPIYIIPSLVDRYERKQITFNQLTRHLELLKTPQSVSIAKKNNSKRNPL